MKRKPVPYRKKDVISSANTKGFRLEADEAEDGRSELEIVVRPPIAETKDGLLELTQIMDDITKIGNGLKSLYNADNKPFSLSEVTGAPLDKYTLITPRSGDDGLTAGPQVTMGLDLAVVSKLNRNAPDRPSDFPKFNGFVSMVKQYVSNGTRQGGAMTYPKMMAEPLLSRNDFVRLLALVEDPVKQKYQGKPNAFVHDVLDHAGLPQSIAHEDMLARGVIDEANMEKHTNLRLQLLELEDPYRTYCRENALLTSQIEKLADKIMNYKAPSGIEKLTRALEPDLGQLKEQHKQLVLQQIQLEQKYHDVLTERTKLLKEKRQLEHPAGFTVGEWLRKLLTGVDLLPGIKDAESLGEFGSKPEKVGPEDKQIDGAIFEWRGDQKNKIPLSKWKDYALGKLVETIKLNGG